MNRLVIAIVFTLLLAPVAARATVFMSQQQALSSAFPAGSHVERQTFFLKDAQIKSVKQKSGADEVSGLVVRYVAKQLNGAVVGYAYFDAHRVRTLPETVMVLVTPAGTIDRVDILSFNEPSDYLPKRRWLDQLRTRRLSDDLAVSRAIRPISGATLSGRAIVAASRKVLAIHEVLGAAAPAK